MTYCPLNSPLAPNWKTWTAEPAAIVQPSFDDKNGHPILLNENVRQAILAADESDPAVNLKTVIEPFQKQLVGISEPGILVDLDTPEDYNRRVRAS